MNLRYPPGIGFNDFENNAGIVSFIPQKCPAPNSMQNTTNQLAKNFQKTPNNEHLPRNSSKHLAVSETSSAQQAASYLIRGGGVRAAWRIEIRFGPEGAQGVFALEATPT